MPVVRYQPDQVQTQTVSQPRASAAAGVAAIQGNIQAAQGLTDLVVAGAEFKQRVDTTSAEEAIVAFEKDKNDLFFNAESGYLKRGKLPLYKHRSRTPLRTHHFTGTNQTSYVCRMR